MTLRERLVRQGPAAILILVAAAFIGLSYQYGEKTRTFPLLVGWTTLVLLVVEFISQGETRLGRTLLRFLSGKTTSATTSERPSNATPARELSAFLWIFSLLLMVMVAGFYISIPVYVFVYLRFFARKSLVLSSSIAVLLTAFLWALFDFFMGYQLFYGFLFGDY